MGRTKLFQSSGAVVSALLQWISPTVIEEEFSVHPNDIKTTLRDKVYASL